MDSLQMLSILCSCQENSRSCQEQLIKSSSWKKPQGEHAGDSSELYSRGNGSRIYWFC